MAAAYWCVINSPSELAEPEIDAACIQGVDAIVLPKVSSALDITHIGRQLDALEAQRGFKSGSLRLIAQIEDVASLPRLDEIAQSPSRLLGIILGSEDFSVSAGMDPIPETLFAPNQQIVFACRRAGILPLGFPASITDYTDLVSFRNHISRARRMGRRSVLCSSISGRNYKRGVFVLVLMSKIREALSRRSKPHIAGG